MMGDHFDEPVLLIKAAWGGHSLFKLFRSPSAGMPSEEALEESSTRLGVRILGDDSQLRDRRVHEQLRGLGRAVDEGRGHHPRGAQVEGDEGEDVERHHHEPGARALRRQAPSLQEGGQEHGPLMIPYSRADPGHGPGWAGEPPSWVAMRTSELT